jgi:hypothetical protein
VRALRDGSASETLTNERSARLVQALQRNSGSDAPIEIRATRLERFVQQPSCGRVQYQIVQPATGRHWSAMDAQLNLCEDGEPPRRSCGSMVKTLVPANQARCADGSIPSDTPEVAASIARAKAAGAIDAAQLGQKVRAAMEQRRAASAATGTSAGAKP